MSDIQDANAQFDALWEAVGKKRLLIGDEDKQIEIRLDLDLSPITLLKRMQELSDQGNADGLLGARSKTALHEVIDEWEQALSDKVPGKLRERWRKLLKEH
jgi:hypothetical protein